MFTALAIRVAAASAAAAVAASTVARVGDAEREGSAAAARGGDAAHRAVVRQGHRAVERLGEDAGAQAVAGREMDRDVAAVVDVGLVERAAGQHRLQHLVGDGAGDGGHRRDEDGTMRPHRLGHAPRDRALQQRIGVTDAAAQDRQLAHQRRQDVAEAIDGLPIRPLDLVAHAERLDDEVDRAVLQMQAAVGQTRGDHSSRTLWARTTSSSVTAREA